MATSNATLSKRKRGRPSKMEEKMSLVLKRLSMLQDDSDIQPVAVEDPTLQHGSPSFSENTMKKTERSVNELVSEDGALINSSSFKSKLCGSTKLVKRVKTEDSSYETSYSLGEFEASNNSRKCKTQRRCSSNDLSEKTNSFAMKRAKEVEADLSHKHPSFVKLMLRSHVTHGFWLGLPKKFTDKHLPECDCTIILEDEDGKKCNTKYLAQKSGLSAGWREFAVTRDLHEGDVVVFHLINPMTFKVYIVREENLAEVDGAPGLLNLSGIQAQRISEDDAEKIANSEGIPLLEDNIQGGSDIELGCEVVDGIHLSNTVISFERMKTFDSFNIVIDGLVIDSKFTNHVRKKYHVLCCSQGEFLHEHLLKGLNCNLVVGIISEVVNIADAIKASSKASASHDDLRVWDQTLKGFNLLGMNVSFLRERLNRMLDIASEPDVTNDSRFRELRLEEAQAAKRLMDLKITFLELKETMKKAELKMEAEIQASVRKQERIKEIANAPC